MSTHGNELIDQLIYNELDRLSDLMETGASDACTPDPSADFEAIRAARPDVYREWSEAVNEAALGV